MVSLLYLPVLYSLFLFSDASAKNGTQIYGNTYRHKDNGFLFQDIKTLTINCDSTFTWKHYCCTQRDTCWGTWSIVNGKVELTSDNELIKAVEKEGVLGLNYNYIDLSNSTLTLNDSFVVWKRTEEWTDTLYKQ